MFAQYLQFLAGIALFVIACVVVRACIDAAWNRPIRPARDDEDDYDTEVIDLYL